MVRTHKDGKGNAGAAVLGKYCKRTYTWESSNAPYVCAETCA